MINNGKIMSKLVLGELNQTKFMKWALNPCLCFKHSSSFTKTTDDLIVYYENDISKHKIIRSYRPLLFEYESIKMTNINNNKTKHVYDVQYNLLQYSFCSSSEVAQAAYIFIMGNVRDYLH